MSRLHVFRVINLSVKHPSAATPQHTVLTQLLGTDAAGAVLWPADLEAALDDVVAVEVADEGDHTRPQGLDHQGDLRSPTQMTVEVWQQMMRLPSHHRLIATA
jgi:hypothetical protein